MEDKKIDNLILKLQMWGKELRVGNYIMIFEIDSSLDLF